jgi:Rps23 Pro-64 3,4-dihydroxylase Tpa1-like proline 4-hydroxylase
MLNLNSHLDESTDVFTLFVAQGLLDPAQVRQLYQSRPRSSKRIVRSELSHEKQYAMNLVYLVENGARNQDAGLSPEWETLVDDLTSGAFMDWLEAGTGLSLRYLARDIGMYTHENGDFISVHKDKLNKALTAILYLNDDWPHDAGGHYEVRRSSNPDDKPVRTIPPRAGQLLAFAPTDRSWHAVAPVKAEAALTRLTVQLEFWVDKSR